MNLAETRAVVNDEPGVDLHSGGFHLRDMTRPVISSDRGGNHDHDL